MGIRRVSGLAWAVALVMALAVAPGCGRSPSADAQAESAEAIRGLIRDVKARSLLELESLALEDEKGVTWKLEARGAAFSVFTPSHLREHMASGEAVTVVFVREKGALVIKAITD